MRYINPRFTLHYTAQKQKIKEKL